MAELEGPQVAVEEPPVAVEEPPVAVEEPQVAVDLIDTLDREQLARDAAKKIISVDETREIVRELLKTNAKPLMRTSDGRRFEPPECLSGLVLQGRIKPTECPEMGRRCTPDTPLGATMVSSEGACAAYFRYRRKA